MKGRSHLKDPRYRNEDNKRKKNLINWIHLPKDWEKRAGQVLVNVAPHSWVPLYAENLSRYRNVTFSHALLHITSLLRPAE
jgi:uncharacterized iron-regulated protein